VMTLWFWVTPILIAEGQFPGWAKWAIRANPLAYVVRAYRELLLGHGMPSVEDMTATAVFAVGSFVVGGLFFRYLKRGFADVL
jgi:lipopolysaccharide transport system permease protein